MRSSTKSRGPGGGALALALLLTACHPTVRDGEPVPQRPMAMPADRMERHEALVDLAERLYATLVSSDVNDALYHVDDLDIVLDESGVARVEALRLGLGSRVHLDPRRHGRFSETELWGLCVLGARQEPAGGTLGLKEDTWILERALVAGQRVGGQRLAAWFEGTFVYSDAGFRAIDLRRVETPRWEHSDLELVTCDMQVGMGAPLDIGMVTD